MMKTAFLWIVFSSAFLPMTFAAAQNEKGKTSNHCPPGEHWVRAHTQRPYIRSDGTSVSGSYHRAGCAKNPPAYAIWKDRLKAGTPSKWELKNEISKPWTEDEKERVLEALSALPVILVTETVSGIYRLKTSSQLLENPAANFQNQIALYDRAFNNKQNVARVLGHEFAHLYFRQMSKPDQVDYAIASEWEATLWAGLSDKELTLNRKGLVEADSVNHPEEDFANNIEYFLFYSKTLKEKSPRVYDWISKKFGDKLTLRGVK